MRIILLYNVIYFIKLFHLCFVNRQQKKMSYIANISKGKFPSEVFFTLRLSGDMRRDDRAIFADISRTEWKSYDGNIVYFIRLELRLNRGQDSKPMNVSLTATQLDWVIECIEKDISHMAIEGEREGKFISFDKIESLFLSEISISTWEKKARFGIIFDSYEKDNLVSNHYILSFILKYQQTSGLRLKELIRWLYCSVLFSYMKEEIKENCKGCKNPKDAKAEHLCKDKIQDLIEKFIGITLEKRELIIFKFNQYFDYFSKLLHISEENVIEAQNLLDCISLAEKNDYSHVLKVLFTNPIDDPVAKSIIRLIELKDGEDVSDSSNRGSIEVVEVKEEELREKSSKKK